jgi:hypothetical protein
MSTKKSGQGEQKGGKDKPRSAGSRQFKFARFADNTRLHKAGRMLRSNGFNEAMRVFGAAAVREVVARAKKTSPNFAKWCERRKIPTQFR